MGAARKQLTAQLLENQVVTRRAKVSKSVFHINSLSPSVEAKSESESESERVKEVHAVESQGVKV